ncbi:MAG: DinB family protein [Acidobacteria bacterium]|nr:DinB family protein [Acidobacteriota bacterium]
MTNVAITDALLPEFDHEMAVTRRLLERVPEADLAWKPHDKSMSLGGLATHLSNLPTWAEQITQQTELDMDSIPPEARPKVPANRVGLLEMFDRNVAAARSRLAAMSDGEYLAAWTFKKGGRIVFTLPRIAALRGFLMNHSIHHRGQLSVYLRLRNVALPAIYGPSADEG